MSNHQSVAPVSAEAQIIEASSNEITTDVAAPEVAITTTVSPEAVTDVAPSEVATATTTSETATTPAKASVTGSRNKKKNRKNKNNKKPQSSTQSAKKPEPHVVVLVESGQEHMGRVSGFALDEDKTTRTGVVLRFKGGDSAFMHKSQIGSHFPDSRLNALKVGDMVRVIVTVKPGEGKRRVKASEKVLFLSDVAKQLEKGLAGVTGEVTKKLPNVGALLKVTSPGAAFGFIGLLHVNSIPNGQRALEAIAVGQSMEIDISRARVDEEKGLLKLTMDAFGAQRREVEHRFPVGSTVSGSVSKDLGESFLLKLKSGDACFLPKNALNGAEPDSIKVGRSTSAFVTGVDARGVLLLSKSMPE